MGGTARKDPEHEIQRLESLHRKPFNGSKLRESISDFAQREMAALHTFKILGKPPTDIDTSRTQLRNVRLFAKWLRRLGRIFFVPPGQGGIRAIDSLRLALRLALGLN